jgi:hypothetical protein
MPTLFVTRYLHFKKLSLSLQNSFLVVERGFILQILKPIQVLLFDDLLGVDGCEDVLLQLGGASDIFFNIFNLEIDKFVD